MLLFYEVGKSNPEYQKKMKAYCEKEETRFPWTLRNKII